MDIQNEFLAGRYARALLCYIDCSRDINFAVRLGALAAFLDLHRYRFSRIERCFYEKLARIFALEVMRIDLLSDLLYKQGRLALLPDVVRHLFELYKKKHNFLFCTMKASHELTPDQKEIMMSFVGRITDKEVVFSVKIDRSLIAGIRIEGDEMVWESSVARQLRAIEQLQ